MLYLGMMMQKLARSSVINALKSQPDLIYELKEVVPQSLHIVETMHHRCCSAFEALPSSGRNLTSMVGQLHEDLLEVMDFINDGRFKDHRNIELIGPFEQY